LLLLLLLLVATRICCQLLLPLLETWEEAGAVRSSTPAAQCNITRHNTLDHAIRIVRHLFATQRRHIFELLCLVLMPQQPTIPYEARSQRAAWVQVAGN
jgi:hypothetical protein